MCLPVHEVFGSETSLRVVHSRSGSRKHDFTLLKVRRIIRMSSQAKSHPGRVLAMLPAMIAVLFTFATVAAAQDQPAPKWELFGGYSVFDPGADVHGVLPGGLFP